MKWMAFFGMFLSFAVNGFAAACGCTVCECEPACECVHPPRAPAGVMGDHIHHKGGWMVSYRYMAMHMEGLRDGDSEIEGGMTRPLEMDSQMHMIGAMYGLRDKLTVALMIPYSIKDMDMLMMGFPGSSHTEGIGDLRLTGIRELWSSDAHQVLLNLAVGLPTGSIDEKNSAGTMRLGYPMQLGSGSWALLPGLTYTGRSPAWHWGAQARASVALHRNKHEYRLGNRYDLQGWAARDLCPVSALSFRLNGWHRENIDGADAGMTPTADPDRYAASRIDAWLGIDYRPSNAPGDVRLVLEGGVPAYQYVDGPQLGAEWMIVGGLQLSF
jgi:hypothetical protein